VLGRGTPGVAGARTPVAERLMGLRQKATEALTVPAA